MPNNAICGMQRIRDCRLPTLRRSTVLLGASAISAVLIGVCALSLIAYAPRLPVRPVGQAVDVKGQVMSVSQEAYAVKIALKVREATSMFKVGEVVDVTFSGIGEVSTWRAYALKSGDVIRVTVRFVENSYWEALDSDWN